MESYTIFADIYDEFMDNIPYNEWGEYLVSLLAEHGIKEGLIVDLACGTGRITRELAECGYDMIGIDISADMLTIARSYCYEYDNDLDADILYLLQDMREFKIIGKAHAIVSICDSMNYMSSVHDLIQVFKGVKESLEADGVFIFDMKTHHFFRDVIGNSTQTDVREDAVLIWENEYDDNSRDNTYYLTMFLQVEDNDGVYERYEEEHIQHAFTLDEVYEALNAAGIWAEAVYEALTKDEPDDTTERVYFICKIK